MKVSVVEIESQCSRSLVQSGAAGALGCAFLRDIFKDYGTVV